ncbi:MAG: TonB-dependent siderophore receptor [Aphanocapsa sp. GSE-SYN-MK-11-07L]|jgi:iron complex outermembrane receptor protein|nr:TonB-dependent siderophore receptor [Aphanocapsa sp. GSE-SYN-MK-11-07L]
MTMAWWSGRLILSALVSGVTLAVAVEQPGVLALPRETLTPLQASDSTSALSLPRGDQDQSDLLSIHDIPQSATTVKDWVAQMEAARVQVTDVKLEPTATGLEIILETAEGKPLQVDASKFRAEGNSLIAEIPDAVLTLPAGQAFIAENPTADIATVQVIQEGSQIRVSVAGKEALPKTEVTLKTGGFAYSLNPEDEASEEELVVTGEGEGRYFIPNTSTATKTDTPIRDLPVSIQIVPRQVLEDRGVRRELEALETVSGVVDIQANLFDAGGVVNIRGFQSNTRLRNGLASEGIFYIAPIPMGTVEQVEVLKGPASVLFGAVEPGGVVNYVTRQPLPEPYYRIGFEAGNYGLYQPTIDLSGPLTQDKRVLYRLIASYQGGGNYKDEVPVDNQRIVIAPSITFNIGDRTSLNLYYEYDNYQTTPSAEPLLSDGSLIPRNVYPLYFSLQENESHRVGYGLNHRFNESWQLRHNLSINLVRSSLASLEYTNLLEDRFLTDFFGLTVSGKDEVYAGQIDLVGNFRTGSISHQLVAGFDLTRQLSYYGDFSDTFDLPPLDIRNPNYDVQLPELPFLPFGSLRINQSYGVYLQDQIAFSGNLKMLIGGRYDWLTNEDGPINGDRTSQNDGAFSPRIGLVYQPTQNVSLYASYSQSFRPSIGRNPDSRVFEPTKGTQYEVGVKADFLNGKLSTTLALYNLTKTNILTPDPDPELARQGFQAQVGEQRSRGIELDMTGEILPGWKVIASYAFTDAQVTADNSIPSTVGQPLRGVPKHQASLWSTYMIQEGDLRGLGFGLGLFYVGERQDNFGNSAQLESYLRTDAALYYRRNRFNAAINVRNLFNIDYVSSPNFGTLFINRGTPLTIVGSISWEF